VRIAWEHNRALALPIRLVHVLWAPWAPVHAWATDSSRRHWAPALLYSALATLALWPLDPWAMERITAGGTRGSLPIGGDVRRELEALQQFGQGGMTVVVALAVWMLDPANRRRLLDWLVAIGVAFVLAFGCKMALGRPRPTLDEPSLMLGPLGMYPVPVGGGVELMHAWAFWREGVSKLWSMPSSHTVFAVVAAGMLASWYPRVRWLVLALAGLVAFGRVAFGAHYPSDVAAGLGVGLIAVGVAQHMRLSDRLGAPKAVPGGRAGVGHRQGF
jgi:membrane-associated phospholipid phosphatase